MNCLSRPHDNSDKLSPRRHHYITALRLGRALQLIAAAVLVTGSSMASAATLGEAELRSYLGEPLNLRIQVSAGDNEALDAGCFSLSRDTQPFAIMRDAQLELTQLRSTQSVSIKTSAALNEPFIRVVLRYGCAGQGATSRDYTLLIDPRPGVILPAVPSDSSAPAARASSPPASAAPPVKTTAPTTSRESGQWVATPADTLAKIAEGIYPKSVRRKARYIASLRALNPALDGIADDAPIPPGLSLTLPDLKALSAPERTVSATEPTRAAATAPAAPNAAQPAATHAPKPLPTPAPPTPPASKPAPTAEPVKAAEPAPPRPREKAPPAKTAGAAAPTAPASKPTFSLRLSGTEIDLSRSANVTEEQRALLREKQFFLDADDQLAQFLALKNAVKQLETRLNEIQSRLPPPPTTTTNTPPQAAPTKASPRPPQASPATPTGSAMIDDAVAVISSPLALVVGALAAAISLAFIWWRRRKRVVAEAEIRHFEPYAEANANPAESAAPAETDVDASAAAPTPDELDLQAEADELALAQRAKRLSDESRPAPTFNRNDVPFDATVGFSLDDPSNTDRFDLDDSPSMTVDLPIGDSVMAGDDERVRRLQYMQQRYPELQQNTVSLDDPDTIVNAARNYLEDAVGLDSTTNHSAAGIDRASELLGFALAERPQEIRYWLAQFEVFRIGGMASQYAELASQFHILFNQSPEWLQVKSIGRELSPTNPLFAANPNEQPAAALLGADEKSWLNQLSTPAPDARRDLAMALRQSLLNRARANGERA